MVRPLDGLQEPFDFHGLGSWYVFEHEGKHEYSNHVGTYDFNLMGILH